MAGPSVWAGRLGPCKDQGIDPGVISTSARSTPCPFKEPRQVLGPHLGLWAGRLVSGTHVSPAFYLSRVTRAWTQQDDKVLSFRLALRMGYQRSSCIHSTNIWCAPVLSQGRAIRTESLVAEEETIAVQGCVVLRETQGSLGLLGASALTLIRQACSEGHGPLLILKAGEGGNRRRGTKSGAGWGAGRGPGLLWGQLQGMLGTLPRARGLNVCVTPRPQFVW